MSDNTSTQSHTSFDNIAFIETLNEVAENLLQSTNQLLLLKKFNKQNITLSHFNIAKTPSSFALHFFANQEMENISESAKNGILKLLATHFKKSDLFNQFHNHQSAYSFSLFDKQQNCLGVLLIKQDEQKTLSNMKIFANRLNAFILGETHTLTISTTDLKDFLSPNKTHSVRDTSVTLKREQTTGDIFYCANSQSASFFETDVSFKNFYRDLRLNIALENTLLLLCNELRQRKTKSDVFSVTTATKRVRKYFARCSLAIKKSFESKIRIK